MAKGYCPECNATINLGKSPRKGQRTACFKCGAELHVANLSPIELDLAFDESFDNGMESGQEYTRKN